jgi:DNA-binding NtrC family response regulator
LSSLGNSKASNGVDTTPNLAPSFQDALTRHPWPGNFREQEDAIQRCVVLNPESRLTGRDLAWLLDGRFHGQNRDRDPRKRRLLPSFPGSGRRRL